MAKPERKMRANLRRCPLLKVTYEELELDKDGKPTGSTKITEEFQECYKSFCMAWTGTGCSYFELRMQQESDDDDDEDPK